MNDPQTMQTIAIVAGAVLGVFAWFTYKIIEKALSVRENILGRKLQILEETHNVLASFPNIGELKLGKTGTVRVTMTTMYDDETDFSDVERIDVPEVLD